MKENIERYCRYYDYLSINLWNFYDSTAECVHCWIVIVINPHTKYRLCSLSGSKQRYLGAAFFEIRNTFIFVTSNSCGRIGKRDQNGNLFISLSIIQHWNLRIFFLLLEASSYTIIIRIIPTGIGTECYLKWYNIILL